MQTDRSRILTERAGNVLIIRINRADARNAFDYDTAAGLDAALDQLDGDASLWVGIITGAGKHFCAGADLKAVANGQRAYTETRGGFGIFERPARKPLIAAVEGFAVGGGFELCLSCDLVVAAETARFGLPEVRHNVVAIGGALFRLQKRMPYNIAAELALTGRFETAAFFHGHGVVNRLAAEGQALNAALELAGEITVNGPTAVWATHEIMFQAQLNAWDEPTAWDRQMPIADTALNSQDAREGLTAFAEKRKPVWTGR